MQAVNGIKPGHHRCAGAHAWLWLGRTLSLAGALNFYYQRRPMHECAEAAVYYFAHAGTPPEGFEAFFADEPDLKSRNRTDDEAAFDDTHFHEDDPFDEDFFKDLLGDLTDDTPGEESDAFQRDFDDPFGMPGKTGAKRLERIKTLYRKIARCLHPDQGGSARVTATPPNGDSSRGANINASSISTACSVY